MSKLDNALDRLGDAVVGLITNLADERDRLQAEVAELKTQRAEDARLREEATGAVKMALVDLRSVAAAQEAANQATKGTTRKASKKRAG